MTVPLPEQQVGATAGYPPGPKGIAIYVIGDIHGRLDLLKKVHHQIDQDKGVSKPRQPVEVYLGDYIDRGPESAGVVSHLLARALDARMIFLRGNHEQFLMDFLEGADCLDEWKDVGAVPSLLSYGVPPALLSRDARQREVRRALADRVPPDHARFYAETETYLDAAPYLLVHAGIRPGTKLQQQALGDLLGIRGEFLEFDGDFGRIVVHGHTPVLQPDLQANRINIDTGAFATNKLTCLKIDEKGARVLSS
jgi:serine/threonine protein phosphatase 1